MRIHGSILWLLVCAAGCAGEHEYSFDFDGDGWADKDDCGPEDPFVYPGAPDLFGDGLDADCDGCATTSTPGAGDGIDRDCDGYPSDEDLGPQQEHLFDCNLQESILTGSTAMQLGGGLAVHNGSEVSLFHMDVTDNEAGAGGGLHINGSSSVIAHLDVTGNSANYGGGLKCEQWDGAMSDFTIADNYALYNGGGMSIADSEPLLSMGEFSGNAAGDNGGGILVTGSEAATLASCDVWANVPNGFLPA